MQTEAEIVVKYFQQPNQKEQGAFIQQLQIQNNPTPQPMIKRANTPVNPPKQNQPPREGPRRIFGKDLKNIITNYHHKLNEQSKSPNKCSLDHANNKVKREARNNSQKVILKEEADQEIKPEFNRREGKKSTSESTQASPKSSSIKEYLKSKAPQAISQISSDLSINVEMRQLVIVWLIELAHKMPIKHETLFHCVLMFDSMLGNYKNTNLTGMVICIENLQLLALACLFISAKYEEIYPPSADFMVKNSDYAYSKKKIIEMEASVLMEQQFILTFPTRFTFLQQILNQISDFEVQKKKRLEHMSLFLLQLSLIELWEDASEEEICQAAIFLAKKILIIETENPNRKICQMTWKLMQTWRSKRSLNKYSFVGGTFLEDV